MYINRARCECQTAVGSSGLKARWSQGRAVEFKFYSLILDLVSETLMGSVAAFSRWRQLVSFRFEFRLPAFSRGRQLVSFPFEYRLPVPEHRNEQQQICISPEPGANAKRLWGQVGWMLADHRDGLSSSSFIAWSSIAQSVCQRAISLLAIWCLRPWWVRILPSAEEDNLYPFDSKIACLCQSIEFNDNKYVYRQSQVRMQNGCGVKWAECLLIIGTGCRVQVL